MYTSFVVLHTRTRHACTQVHTIHPYIQIQAKNYIHVYNTYIRNLHVSSIVKNNNTEAEADGMGMTGQLFVSYMAASVVVLEGSRCICSQLGIQVYKCSIYEFIRMYNIT